jgi:hypothetical protein
MLLQDKTLDENGTTSLLSTLMGSGASLDLPDYPSKSSGLFGNQSNRFSANQKLEESGQQQHQPIELAMQQLYVSEDDQHRQRAGSTSQVRGSGTPSRGSGGNGANPSSGSFEGQPPSSQQPSQPGHFRQGQNNGQQAMPHALPPMQYVPIDPNTGAPIPGAQPQYYVQQPMFLDQNGQPVYYRVGPQGQFQQDMMFGAGPDGNSEQMMAFLPYPPNGPQFWMNPGGVHPEQNSPGAPMFVNSGTNGHMNQDNGRGQHFGGSRHNGHSSHGGFGNHGGRGGGSMGFNGNRGDPMEHLGMFSGHTPGNGIGRPNGSKERGERFTPLGYRPDRPDRTGRGAGAPASGGGGGGSGGGRGGNGVVNPTRDPLVDEFRTTYGKSRQWELIDLIGHVVAFCQDQHGSRFIQQRLEVCTEVDKQLIFDEIAPSAPSLMTDVFGNYVLQKLFEYGTPDQCETLAALLTGQAVLLSMQMYGCRVVQKALEYVNTQRLITIVGEFENSQVLLRCVHDSNGNHVIQKCIEVVSKASKEASTPDMSDYLSSRIMFIINSFQGRVKELSSHPYGCRVVQRILEHCSSPQKAIILEELRKCCSELVQDCYGNYVIQFVMQHGWDADRAVLIKEVQAHLLDFSQHKFASNVVEKCLQYANKRDRDEMIWAIINITFDLNNPVDAKTGHCVLESMVRDPYANYVVQKVIDVSDERQRAAIVRYVKENIVQLRRYTYGKHIIVRLEKITNDKF